MQENDITNFIESEINNNDVVLFMKGTKQFPQCGYSSLIVNILSKLNIKFKDINVLADNSLREGIKIYADWPTIPQLYIKGQFIGGSDIIRSMHESGELEELLTKQTIPYYT